MADWVSLKGHHIVKKIDFRVLTKFGIFKHIIHIFMNLA